MTRFPKGGSIPAQPLSDDEVPALLSDESAVRHHRLLLSSSSQGPMGRRIGEAIAALEPLGLGLALHGPKFLVTSKPDDPEHPGQEFATIGEVEEFIAGRRPTAPVIDSGERDGT